jgi:DNA adenine methylase
VRIIPRTYSPLRYPGGKTQLANFLIELIDNNQLKNNITYAEPFSGGFGAGLELLFNKKISNAIINDYDIGIYSIWYAVLNETQRLINDIQNIRLDIEEWQNQKNIYSKLIKDNIYSYELAFATYFLNRTNVSGIITGGPIGGKNQKGNYKLDCRFNRQNLSKKIEKISEYKNSIQLYNLEANIFIKQVLLNYEPETIFIFFDPPYYEHGKNLYTNFFEHDDHVKLKETIEYLNEYYWILTYDNKEEILSIYKNYNKHLYSINYCANKVKKANEILIRSNKLNIYSYDNIDIKNI